MNNMGSNNNFTASRDINQKFNKSNQNQINKVINKIYNSDIPKRISKEEKEKHEKLTNRPCLKDKLNQRITCFGYIVGKYPFKENLYTVVNVVDISGNFVADHIQLNIKEDEYDYEIEKRIGNYIRFTGNVVTYTREDSTIDYTVDISKKIIVMYEDYDLYLEPYEYEYHPLNIEKIDEYIRTQNITKLYDLIENIRNEINELTDGTFIKDYLYYYIISQYTLNTSTYSVYEGELRDQKFNETCIVGILLLLGSTLFSLKSGDSSLRKLLENIVIECNVLQGIKTYTSYSDNPNFKLFYEDNLLQHRMVVGKKKLKEAFKVIKNRFYNFKQNKPYDENKIDCNVIKLRAYHMIQKLI